MTRLLLLLMLFFATDIFAECQPDAISVMSWNIQNLGGSLYRKAPSKDISELETIIQTVKGSDIVAIQEVMVSTGAKAIALIADGLNRTGAKWDYSVSDPTSGRGSERYAFLWKTSKVFLVKAWLSQSLSDPLDREPFIGQFRLKRKTILIFNLQK
ncbi:MAG: hypothetical protein HQM12_23360 [SAR324 cluster bacterium]|nr:hypothetical protein [SAR324 cluster bacterium]